MTSPGTRSFITNRDWRSSTGLTLHGWYGGRCLAWGVEVEGYSRYPHKGVGGGYSNQVPSQGGVGR